MIGYQQTANVPTQLARAFTQPRRNAPRIGERRERHAGIRFDCNAWTAHL
jgi:hypothetical protein